MAATAQGIGRLLSNYFPANKQGCPSCSGAA